METARVILERGGVVGIFPEGTRVRPGPAGRAEARRRPPGARDRRARSCRSRSSAPSDIRRGWLIRPRRVTVRCGRALTFPRPARPRAAPGGWRRRSRTASGRASRCSGSGSAACSRSATRSSSAPAAGARPSRRCWPARAPPSSSVCRTRGAGARARPHPHQRRLPARRRAARRACRSRSRRRAALGRGRPASAWRSPRRSLDGRARVGARRACRRDVGVLVLSKGLVAPHGTLPSALVAERAGRAPGRVPRRARSRGRGRAGAARRVTVASPDRTFAALLASRLPQGGPRTATRAPTWSASSWPAPRRTPPRSRPARRSRPAPNAAGAAAGRVYEECHALADTRGALGVAASPARPAPATWSRPCSPRTAATAARESCSRRASSPRRSRRSWARCPSRCTRCRCWPAR